MLSRQPTDAETEQHSIDEDDDSPLGSPVFRVNNSIDEGTPYGTQRHPDSYYRPETGPVERFWTDRYEFFLNKGYELRSRYRPGWIPSWITSGKSRIRSEDFLTRFHTHIVDAKCTNDGSPVVVKHTFKKRNELEIMLYFSSPQVAAQAANHVVQLIKVFKDPFNPHVEFFLMPLLRPYNDPEFGAVGEVVDFVTQVLEGLSFIHSHGIAHNDCTNNNIMMDARPLLPNGWHPISEHYSPDYTSYVRPYARIDYPVRYFFIDFGLSHRFQPGQRHVVYDYGGADQDVPEYGVVGPYDPFKADIYTLANIFLKEFHQKFVGIEFLGKLVDFMQIERPKKRPTAQMALDEWLRIKSGLDPKQDRWRLRKPSETIPERVVLDAVAAARTSIHGISQYFV